MRRRPGAASAARLLVILRDPRQLDNYVAACQVGITLSSLVAGAYGQAQLTPLLEPVFGDAGRTVAVLIVLVAITAVQVVLGELLPKTIAMRYPERLAMATLPAMRVSQWIFRPLVTVFNGSAFALMRVWGLNVDHSHAHVHSPEELAGLYRAECGGRPDRGRRAGHVGGRAARRDADGARDHDASASSRDGPRHDAGRRIALTLLAGTAHTRFPVTARTTT